MSMPYSGTLIIKGRAMGLTKYVHNIMRFYYIKFFLYILLLLG